MCTITFHTPFAELKSCKPVIRSELPTFVQFSVSNKLLVCKKCCTSPNKMARDTIISHRNEGIGALKQHVLFTESSKCRSILAPIGLESTLNKMSKWLLVGFFYTVILLRRDAKVFWLSFGANLNGGLAILLKKIIKQERPLSNLKSDGGMPSSHAQSIFFNVFMANLSLIELLGMNRLTMVLAGIFLAFGSYFSWLRVSQQFHTSSQVIVGGLMGSIFCIFWFWLWDAIVMKAFFSYFWIRIFLVFGGLGFNIFLTLCTCQNWISEAKRFWLWDAIVMKAFFSYFWIRIFLVFGGLGFNIFLTLCTCQNWISEAKRFPKHTLKILQARYK